MAHADSGTGDGTLRVPHTGSFSVSEPTAEAAHMSRHIEGSIDYASGRATYGVELMRVEADGISVPITLSTASQ